MASNAPTPTAIVPVEPSMPTGPCVSALHCIALTHDRPIPECSDPNKQRERRALGLGPGQAEQGLRELYVKLVVAVVCMRIEPAFGIGHGLRARVGVRSRPYTYAYIPTN